MANEIYHYAIETTKTPDEIKSALKGTDARVYIQSLNWLTTDNRDMNSLELSGYDSEEVADEVLSTFEQDEILSIAITLLKSLEIN